METGKHKIAPTHDGPRKLKATVGNSKKRAKAIQAIVRFVEGLDKLKGTPFAVQCGFLHGAFARGARRFQQVDTLLVLEKNADEVDAFDFIIDDIFCDIYLDTGIYFYLDFGRLPQFPRLKSGVRDVLLQRELHHQLRKFDYHMYLILIYQSQII